MGMQDEVDEQIMMRTDLEKEVELLTAALEAEKKKSASAATTGDKCQTEGCDRHVDWWCDVCTTAICQRCSSRKKCQKDKQHNLIDLEKHYMKVKEQFIKWNDAREEKLLLLEFKQGKLVRRVKQKLQKLTDASEDSLCDEADSVVELGTMMKSLEPITKQVQDLKGCMSQCVDDVESLSMVDLLRVVNEIDVDFLSSAPDSTKSDKDTPPSPSTTAPSALKFISQHDTNNEQCTSVHHHSVSGDILLGCKDSVKIYSRQSGEVTHVVSYPAAKVTEYIGQVFISSRSSSEETITVYNYDMTSKHSEVIFSFPKKSNLASYLSVSAQYIASLEKGNENIKLYNRRSAAVSTKHLSGLKVLHNLLFLPDETLLVTGHDNVKCMINKYRVREEEEPVLVWSCDQVPDAYGVAVDERGLIYVSGQGNKTIYILSAEGLKLNEMKHDQLTVPFCQDISVRDDELAVAGWNDNNLKLFELTK